MKVVIVSGGAPPSLELLQRELKDSSILIAADSGANILFKYQIFPHYLIGDFDSIEENVFTFFSEKGAKIEEYPKDKDFTDTELALKKAKLLNAAEIVFLGCTGNRLDHTLGNIGLLRQCLNLDIKASLKDDKNEVILISKPVKLNGTMGQNFSLLAYGKTVKELTLKDCKFELVKYDLEMGDPLTLSNEFLNKEVSIDFSSDGLLLLLLSND